jgi:hypothetical protein
MLKHSRIVSADVQIVGMEPAHNRLYICMPSRTQGRMEESYSWVQENFTYIWRVEIPEEILMAFGVLRDIINGFINSAYFRVDRRGWSLLQLGVEVAFSRLIQTKL